MADSTDEISLERALEVLERLQKAAPESTAQRLGQVGALLQNLSEEVAYLTTLVNEAAEGDSPPILSSAADLLDSPAEFAPDELEDDPDFNLPVTRQLHNPEAQPPSPEFVSPEYQDAALLLTGINEVLRPPLVAIRGRAELVQAGLIGQVSEAQGQWLNAIYENTSRAFTLLDGVQQVIALNAGEVALEKTNFIATDLLEEARDRVYDAAIARDHSLEINVPDVIPLATGDFYQSLIILTDILDNAVRYTPEGGEIRLSVDNLGTHTLFSVADNGIGLRPEDMALVGLPFWRGENHPLVRQHPGTGLRLYLAKRLLLLQNGELIFSGEPDVGSTFSFTLESPGN